MNFVFIADFIYPTVRGGAEHNDKIMLEFLKKNGHTIKIYDSMSITLDDLKNIDKKNKFIISNFGLLHQDKINFIRDNFKYIIYEHDHKYLIHRNPSKYKNFIAPKEDIINLAFYEKAIKVFCQSKFHEDILNKNLVLNNTFNISGNFWSDEDLNIMKIYSSKNKKECCSIIYSNNAHKNFNEAIKYCELKNLSYNLISNPEYKIFLDKMSDNNCLLFLPRVPETLSRIVVECRMMKMKVITNNLVGARGENWFNMSGEPLIEYMWNRRKIIIEEIEKAFS